MFIMMIEDHEVKVGDEVRVGMQLMIVDEITEFDTVVVIDQDGGELELTENEIDVFINRWKARRIWKTNNPKQGSTLKATWAARPVSMVWKRAKALTSATPSTRVIVNNFLS